MPRPATTLLLVSAVAAGSLVAASLAFVAVLPTWALLFFYVLPSLFLGAWGAGAYVPSGWRRLALPLRRRWRQSPLAPSRALPPAPPPPEPRSRASEPSGATGAVLWAARTWLRLLRPALQLLRSPRARLVRTAATVLATAAVLAWVARELSTQTWPLASLDVTDAAAATAFFFATFALRAVGWQLLFRPAERPRSLVLATSNGAAAVASLAFPSRIDDAVTVAFVRRLMRRAPSIGTIALSLFVLGLLDVASLAPLAVYATIGVHAVGAVRITLAAIAFVGVGGGAVALLLPSIRSRDRLVRHRFGHWLALHAPTSRWDAAWAWLFVLASWLTQCAATLLLLHGLGVRRSFVVATAYVVAGAGASTLPFGPAGAATEAGAGAAVLAGAGIEPSRAIALAVVAQGLTTAAGAVLAVIGVTFARGFAPRRSGA